MIHIHPKKNRRRHTCALDLPFRAIGIVPIEPPIDSRAKSFFAVAFSLPVSASFVRLFHAKNFRPPDRFPSQMRAAGADLRLGCSLKM